MRRFTTTTKRRPELLHIRRWSAILNVSLMQLKFVLATHDEFAGLKSHDYLTAAEAHRVAAAAKKCP